MDRRRKPHTAGRRHLSRSVGAALIVVAVVVSAMIAIAIGSIVYPSHSYRPRSARHPSTDVALVNVSTVPMGERRVNVSRSLHRASRRRAGRERSAIRGASTVGQLSGLGLEYELLRAGSVRHRVRDVRRDATSTAQLLNMTFVYPLQSNWSLGDYSIQCIVHPPAGPGADERVVPRLAPLDPRGARACP